jgi:hypothetical protein
MALVRNANVLLEIEEDEVEKYLGKGYSLLDENGNVVKSKLPTEVAELQKLCIDKDKIIADQKIQIEALQNEIKSLKVIKPIKTEEVSEPVVTSKTSYKRKKSQ